MSDFESNIRSVERAVKHLQDPITGYARLVPDGVHIHIIDHKTTPDGNSVDHMVQWHELASWTSPIGQVIVNRMIERLKPVTKIRNP